MLTKVYSVVCVLIILTSVFAQKDLVESKDESKESNINRDKRTIGVVLRNVADLFGYDVQKRPTVIPPAPAMAAPAPGAAPAPAAAPARPATRQGIPKFPPPVTFPPILQEQVRKTFNINFNWNKNLGPLPSPTPQTAQVPAAPTPVSAPKPAAPRPSATPAANPNQGPLSSGPKRPVNKPQLFKEYEYLYPPLGSPPPSAKIDSGYDFKFGPVSKLTNFDDEPEPSHELAEERKGSEEFSEFGDGGIVKAESADPDAKDQYKQNAQQFWQKNQWALQDSGFKYIAPEATAEKNFQQDYPQEILNVKESNYYTPLQPIKQVQFQDYYVRPGIVTTPPPPVILPTQDISQFKKYYVHNPAPQLLHLSPAPPLISQPQEIRSVEGVTVPPHELIDIVNRLVKLTEAAKAEKQPTIPAIPTLPSLPAKYEEYNIPETKLSPKTPTSYEEHYIPPVPTYEEFLGTAPKTPRPTPQNNEETDGPSSNVEGQPQDNNSASPKAEQLTPIQRQYTVTSIPSSTETVFIDRDNPRKKKLEREKSLVKKKEFNTQYKTENSNPQLIEHDYEIFNSITAPSGPAEKEQDVPKDTYQFVDESIKQAEKDASGKLFNAKLEDYKKKLQEEYDLGDDSYDYPEYGAKKQKKEKEEKEKENEKAKAKDEEKVDKEESNERTDYEAEYEASSKQVDDDELEEETEATKKKSSKKKKPVFNDYGEEQEEPTSKEVEKPDKKKAKKEEKQAVKEKKPDRSSFDYQYAELKKIADKAATVNDDEEHDKENIKEKEEEIEAEEEEDEEESAEETKNVDVMVGAASEPVERVVVPTQFEYSFHPSAYEKSPTVATIEAAESQIQPVSRTRVRVGRRRQASGVDPEQVREAHASNQQAVTQEGAQAQAPKQAKAKDTTEEPEFDYIHSNDSPVKETNPQLVKGEKGILEPNIEATDEVYGPDPADYNIQYEPKNPFKGLLTSHPRLHEEEDGDEAAVEEAESPREPEAPEAEAANKPAESKPEEKKSSHPGLSPFLQKYDNFDFLKEIHTDELDEKKKENKKRSTSEESRADSVENRNETASESSQQRNKLAESLHRQAQKSTLPKEDPKPIDEYPRFDNYEKFKEFFNVKTPDHDESHKEFEKDNTKDIATLHKEKFDELHAKYADLYEGFDYTEKPEVLLKKVEEQKKSAEAKASSPAESQNTQQPSAPKDKDAQAKHPFETPSEFNYGYYSDPSLPEIPEFILEEEREEAREEAREAALRQLGITNPQYIYNAQGQLVPLGPNGKPLRLRKVRRPHPRAPGFKTLQNAAGSQQVNTLYSGIIPQNLHEQPKMEKALPLSVPFDFDYSASENVNVRTSGRSKRSVDTSSEVFSIQDTYNNDSFYTIPEPSSTENYQEIEKREHPSEVGPLSPNAQVYTSESAKLKGRLRANQNSNVF